MGLETATYISELNSAWPLGGDPVNKGDDHTRLLKAVLQAQFPNLTAAAITASAADLNKTTGIEAGAEVNPTNAEIKTAYEANADTNAFTDADEAKLDGIYHGRVNSAGTVLSGSSGFTISKPGDEYRITHNFGDTDYSVVITPDNALSGSGFFGEVLSRNANSVDIYIKTQSTGGPTSRDFNFFIMRD